MLAAIKTNKEFREERVLIFTPVGKDAELTCNVLQAASLDCFACRSAESLFSEMESGLAALLLAEETLTPDLVERLARQISSQPTWSDLPVLLLTSVGASSPALRRPIEVLGNVTLLERPVRTAALISAVSSALRARRRQYGMREAEERKDEFLASLGHELRNPLAPIRAAVGILERTYPESPEVTNICAIVERQVTHLTRLVDDLLDVARITRGKVVLQRKPTTLRAVIEHAVEMCAGLAQSARHDILVSQPDGDILLVADHARLVQSLANVLTNAIKFTPASGKIWLSAEVEKTRIVIRVKDSGIGLDPQSLTRIFELFAQSEVAAGHIKGGLGIGLSLTKQFVEMHGGNVFAYSEGMGRGSEFIITLPRVATFPAPSKKGLPEKIEPLVPVTKAVPTRVLVVDDNHDAADMLCILFRAHDFEVSCAYSGEEALNQAESFKPDVVVMDLGMPGMDGYEVARRLRERFHGRDLTLIALTGWGQDQARRKAIEVGFDYHLVKPVDIEVLKEYISQS